MQFNAAYRMIQKGYDSPCAETRYHQMHYKDIDIKDTGHDCKGEEMYKYSPEYNYGLQTATNPANEYNNGSNPFIHCKGAKPFTMGCVALDEEYMITILKKSDQGMRVYYSEMYIQQ